MRSEKLMKVIGDADENYVQSALETRTQKKSHKGLSFVSKLVLVAAIIASLTVTVYAADGSIIQSWASGGFGSRIYDSYEKLDAAMERAGFEIEVVEKFENGYVFDDMKVYNTSGFDENNNKVLTFKKIGISYTNPTGHQLSLSTEKDMRGSWSETPAKETRQIGDITVEYYESIYRYLPAEKEGNLTEEEQLWEQQPGHYITYYSGSGETSEEVNASMHWVKDGISYSFIDLGAEAGADALFSMAEELIGK